MDSQLDCVPHAQHIHTHTSLWDSCTQYSKTSEQRTHLGTGHLSLVERLCSSQRFCFKPIGIFLMTKITLKVFEMYYYNTFYFIFCFDMMVSPIANGKSNTTWIKKVEWCKINTWLLFVTALILQVQNTEVSVIHTRYNSTGMVIQAVECAMRSHFLATPLPYANKKGW